MSRFQPSFFMHHEEVGFQKNCSKVDRQCQVVCRGFTSHKRKQGSAHIAVEPFGDLPFTLGSNSTNDLYSEFPVSVTDSHSHVTLACNNSMRMPCELDCGCSSERTMINPENYKTVEERSDTDNKHFFWTVLMLRSIGAIPFGPSISLSDSISYDILGKRFRNVWGQQRMFGSLSWGLVAAAIGAVLHFSYADYSIIFYFSVISGVIAGLIALFWLPKVRLITFLTAPPAF